ncbi:hypothetical protein BO94DRAFT_538689 [Aspergillus sclerotioniger CBS 115572]|uniref:Uncharacterized protein n=1 Tax=Aspergillus sclerotioniger CBS 115572 TaxID=1450535 RepID=A0A317VMS6_9EURO|nr:hypothetical protein BO94DRAFT_538689 [Aspergillus sclerotioniger CBS 115572]PWY74531.1 hypothetical protein BO94DRAFT_538689 [Aspergillus sclerotioniger CBS 115572]
MSGRTKISSGEGLEELSRVPSPLPFEASTAGARGDPRAHWSVRAREARQLPC